MTRAFRIHPEALRELGDAIEWLNQGGQGRGDRFRDEFDGVIDRCLQWPDSGARVEAPGSGRSFRKARIPRSYFAVIYYTTEDLLTVVAVAHDRRLPQYWTERD